VHPQFEPGILKKCLVGWLIGKWKSYIGVLEVCLSELMSRNKRRRSQAYIYPLRDLCGSPDCKWRRPHISRTLTSIYQTRCLHRTMTILLWFDWLSGLCGRYDVGLRVLCGVLGSF
jgi:hypothetical protein